MCNKIDWTCQSCKKQIQINPYITEECHRCNAKIEERDIQCYLDSLAEDQAIEETMNYLYNNKWSF